MLDNVPVLIFFIATGSMLVIKGLYYILKKEKSYKKMVETAHWG
jgi:hypothetical protein